jgi:hypothetical protein
MTRVLRNKWKMMNIIKDAIIKNNGLIFGGFVRDSIIHDHFTKLYYDQINTNNDNNEMNSNVDIYSDPTWMEDTKDRLIVPNDIDCFMTENDYNLFVNGLRFQRLMCNVVFNRDASSYITGFDRNKDDTLRHLRLHVVADLKFVKEELQRLPFQFEIRAFVDELKEDAPAPIQVDIITSKKHYNTPFMTNLDFECNGLYISKHGISIAEELVEDTGELARFKQVSKIVEDIIHRVAVYCHPINTTDNIGARVKKMVCCGWKIKDSQGCVISVIDENYEGHCIICHEDVPNLHFKMTCCDARYHGTCMRKSLECSLQTDQCIMCKKWMPFLSTHLQMF